MTGRDNKTSSSPTIRNLQHILTTGDNPYINIKDRNAVLLHYVEEVGELVKAVRKWKTNDDFDKIVSEIGDQLILLCFVSSSLSIDLQSATECKIKENIREKKFKPESHSLDLESLFG